MLFLLYLVNDWLFLIIPPNLSGFLNNNIRIYFADVGNSLFLSYPENTLGIIVYKVSETQTLIAKLKLCCDFS